MDTQITVVGNVGWDPNRRVLASGAVVTDFRVATTPRRLDKATGAWRDLETMWFTVTCWRALADHVADSVRKGDKVVVTGRLQAKSWKTKEGEPRSGLEIEASAVGFDLSRGPATQQRSAPQVERVVAGEPVEDPWATPGVVDPTTGQDLVPEPAAA